MSDAEKAAIKGFAHYLVDTALPAIADAEASKLPVAYSALVQAILKAVEPSLVAQADAYIDSKLA